MHSLQDLPFEIVQNIIDHLDSKDKLGCTTLCKSLYQASLESLYQHVTISTLDQFRLFLRSITHHPHNPNIHVKRLCITIGNWIHNDTYDYYSTMEERRPMMFTEFELLARFCVNLQHLYFPYYVGDYWRFMQELDLQHFWLKLSDIPALRDFQSGVLVYQYMASRLVKLDLRGPFKEPINLKNLLPQMHNLEVIRIIDKGITLDMDIMHQINNSVPRLEELELRTRFTTGTNKAISPRRATTVKTLHCDIDHIDSDWFPLIKTLYKNINLLSIGFKGKHNDADHLFSMIPRVQDIIQSTNIQFVKCIYSHIEDMANFAENFILETVYGYDVMNLSSTSSSSSSTVALELDYVDFTNSREYTDLFTSQFSKGGQTSPQHEFTLKCGVDKEYNYNAVNLLRNVLDQPIHLQVTRLVLNRRYTLISTGFCLGNEASYPVYLDLLLDYFPNLQSLSIQFDVTKVDGRYRRRNGRILPPAEYDAHQKYSKLTLLDDNNNKRTMAPKQLHLQYLKIKSTGINRAVYPYLFKKCPNLSTLCIHDCRLKDEETVVALEYLCLMHNVELLYFE